MKYYKLMYDYEHDDKYMGCSKGTLNEMSKYIVSQGEIISSCNNEILQI